MCIRVCAHLFNVASFDSIYQAHPWFKDIEWEKLYQMEAAFMPEVKGDLDTQNFDKFEEVRTDGYHVPYNVVIQLADDFCTPLFDKCTPFLVF